MEGASTEGIVRNKSFYVALAFDTEGQKHVLGLWIEGAKLWLRVMNEAESRGLEHILTAGLRRQPHRAPPDTGIPTGRVRRGESGMSSAQSGGPYRYPIIQALRSGSSLQDEHAGAAHPGEQAVGHDSIAVSPAHANLRLKRVPAVIERRRLCLDRLLPPRLRQHDPAECHAETAPVPRDPQLLRHGGA